MELRDLLKKMCGILILCCCCCMALSQAHADLLIEMTSDEWTWEEMGVSTFHGSIRSDQDLSGAVLTLTAETRLEDSGQAVFTVFDGKKLKIRKQGPELTEDLPAGKQISFEGEWELPENTGEGLAWATIRLSVKNAEGQEVGAGFLEAGSREQDSSVASASPTHRADQLILVLIIASAAAWLLAFTRHLLVNRTRERKG